MWMLNFESENAQQLFHIINGNCFFTWAYKRFHGKLYFGIAEKLAPLDLLESSPSSRCEVSSRLEC